MSLVGILQGPPCVHVWFHCVTACIQLIKVEQRNTELNNLSQLAILPQEVASAELASVSANCACCGNETLRCCGGELRRFKMLRAFCRDFALSFGSQQTLFCYDFCVICAEFSVEKKKLEDRHASL